MRILYLMFSFSTGGMEKLVGDICNSMVERNHDVTLCIINDLYSDEMLKRLDEKIKVIIFDRKPGEGSKFKIIKSIAQMVKVGKIDVIHCNGINTPEIIVLAKILKPSLKICYTIHDVGQYKKLSKKQIILRNMLCKKLIAISKCVEDEMIQYGAMRKKVITVYNAIDVNKYTNNYNKENFNINNIKICNVARIVPEKKGQDLLIRAISELKKEFSDMKCYFIGEDLSDEKLNTNYLKKLISELNVKESIYFLGGVSNVPEILNTMDIFVLPSRYEGFGLALVEAMACELPCIASELDGPHEIIGDEERGLLFEANNYRELVEKLRNMILNIDYYIDKTKMNRKYVVNNFDLEKMITRLEEVYNI